MLYSTICCYIYSVYVQGLSYFKMQGPHVWAHRNSAAAYGHFHCSIINFLLDSSIPLYISIMP